MEDKYWFGLVVLMLVAIIAFGGYGLYTGKSLEAILVIVGGLLAKIGTLLDYKYGSSQGSKDKTELLNQK